MNDSISVVFLGVLTLIVLGLLLLFRSFRMPASFRRNQEKRAALRKRLRQQKKSEDED